MYVIFQGKGCHKNCRNETGIKFKCLLPIIDHIAKTKSQPTSEFLKVNTYVYTVLILWVLSVIFFRLSEI